MDLSGKNVIYVGGFGGVGSKCAEAFLTKSVKSLIIFDWMPNDEFLKYLQDTYKNSYVDYVHMDLAKHDTISKAFKEARKMIGHFDIVVNGAAIVLENNVDMVLAINLTGLIHSTLEAMEYMSKASGGPGGLIVNISSAAGLATYEIACVYLASKYAVTSFTKSFAKPSYYAQTGVSFITVCNGPTLNPAATMVAKYSSDTLEDVDVEKMQSPEVLAKNFVEIFPKAKNGTTWLLESGKIYEVELPSMAQPGQKKK